MSSLARHRSPATRRAFTLVEVAIVVVIVGVLAVIGVAGYRRYMATARVAEATNMTGDIRAAQEAYKTERGVYAAISNDTSSFYPADNPGKFATAWGKDCTNCKGGDPNGWKKLTVHPSGPLVFGYATVAGVGDLASNPPPPAATFAMASPSAETLKATDPYFITIAWGDTDGDGVPCIVTGYSFSNQLITQAAGE
jgi:type IV pilus assembly protein PilA